MSRCDARVPQRTCVGCRLSADKLTLLRIVHDRGTGRLIVSDKAPGRGAYLHRDPACLARALRRRSIARALRVEDLPTDELAALMTRPPGGDL